jgi:choice-of-anchor A domain-containing protein
MSLSMRSALLISSGLLLSSNVSALSIESPEDYFTYFNVYSLGDIGSSTDRYNTDFEGSFGAAGDGYFDSFGAPNLGGAEYVYHGGGNLTAQGGYKGNIEVAGNVQMNNFHIHGDLHAGGNVNLHASGDFGDVYMTNLAGLVQTNTGGTRSYIEQAFNAEIDLADVSDYFASFSNLVAAKDATDAVLKNNGGIVELNATSGENVFSVDAADLKNAYAVHVNGPEDAIIYLNVVGVADNGDVRDVDGANWHYNGGVRHSDVLVNFNEDGRIDMHGSNNVNVLAPFMDVYFTGGVLTGNLITGNLYGGSQVNIGFFDAPEQGVPEVVTVPEPGSIALMLAGVAGLLMNRRKKMI